MRKLFSEGDDVVIKDYILPGLSNDKVYIDTVHVLQDEVFGDNLLLCSCSNCKFENNNTQFDASFYIPVDVLLKQNKEYQVENCIEFSDGPDMLSVYNINLFDHTYELGNFWLNHIEGDLMGYKDDVYVTLELYIPTHFISKDEAWQNEFLSVLINTKNGLDTECFRVPDITIPLVDIKELDAATFKEYLQALVLKEMGNRCPEFYKKITGESFQAQEVDVLAVRDFIVDDENEFLWVLAEKNGRCCYVGFSLNEVPGLPIVQNAYDSDEAKNMILNVIKGKNINPVDLPHIEDTDSVLQYLWHDIVLSSNLTHFIEEEYPFGGSPWDSLKISKSEFEKRMDAAIEKFALGDVIVKGDGDALYTVYGDFQSRFSQISDFDKYKFSASEKDEKINNLVSAGVWDIDEEYVRDIIDNKINPVEETVDFVGSVEFGNYSYDLHNFTKSQCNYLDVDVYSPCEFAERKEDFVFKSKTLKEYWEKDVPDCYLCHPRLLTVSDSVKTVDDFKREVVKCLLSEQLISVDLLEDYKALKEEGMGFYQQLEKHYNKVLKDTINKKSLSDEDLNYLGIHYHNKYAGGEITDLEATNNKIVRQMITDGLSPKKIESVYRGIDKLMCLGPDKDNYVKAILQSSEVKKMVRKIQGQEQGR
ncbi:hypothetical protein [Anaerovibrio sp.]|uniref:hypothetical protein n=1 Tax=Anaerovibrio sp. TaxID=1872532 RepID=UPI0038902145